MDWIPIVFWILMITLFFFMFLKNKSTCPFCDSRLIKTDLGMPQHTRWVCTKCDYEDKHINQRPEPAWVHWRYSRFHPKAYKHAPRGNGPDPDYFSEYDQKWIELLRKNNMTPL